MHRTFPGPVTSLRPQHCAFWCQSFLVLKASRIKFHVTARYDHDGHALHGNEGVNRSTSWSHWSVYESTSSVCIIIHTRALELTNRTTTVPATTLEWLHHVVYCLLLELSGGNVDHSVKVRFKTSVLKCKRKDTTKETRKQNKRSNESERLKEENITKEKIRKNS